MGYNDNDGPAIGDELILILLMALAIVKILSFMAFHLPTLTQALTLF
jgi:hypothetical protein